MAGPTYATNLSLFKDFETASTISTEVTGYTNTAKGEDQEADFPIQGSQHASAEQRSAATGSLVSDYGSNITWTSGHYFFLWGIFLAPNAVNTDASAGIEMFVGPSITQGYKWTVGGRDFGRYPYGGWQNFVVDPELTTNRTAIGSYTGSSYRWVGMLCDVTSAIAKGSPYGIDVIRYGRGDITAINGEAADYATFAGMATSNDASTAKWGLFQDNGGTYLWKGLMSLGTTTAVDFRDSNRTIVVDNTRRVQSTFNAIEVNHASSNIEWENITIKSLCTVSPGTFEMVDDATVEMLTSNFTDMGTFTFDSNATVTSCTFLRCGLVTVGAGDFDGCTFDSTSDSSKAVLCATPAEAALIQNCTFNSSGTGHAIEIGGTAANITLSGNIFTGYDTADPGTSTNKALYVNIATGSMTITVSGGSGLTQDSVRTAGCTVTVNSDTTVTFTGIKDNSEIKIYKVSDDSLVDGIEDATAGTSDERTFAWSAPATTEVYYRIHCFEPGDEVYETIYNPSFTVPSNDVSIQINQRLDRNAEN